MPGVIFKSLKVNQEETLLSKDEGNPIKLTDAEVQHFKRLESKLSLSPNEKESFISLSFGKPEPLMAAQIAQFAQELLQHEVITYKISNSREQLKFTEER